MWVTLCDPVAGPLTDTRTDNDFVFASVFVFVSDFVFVFVFNFVFVFPWYCIVVWCSRWVFYWHRSRPHLPSGGLRGGHQPNIDLSSARPICLKKIPKKNCPKYQDQTLKDIQSGLWIISTSSAYPICLKKKNWWKYKNKTIKVSGLWILAHPVCLRKSNIDFPKYQNILLNMHYIG